MSVNKSRKDKAGIFGIVDRMMIRQVLRLGLILVITISALAGFQGYRVLTQVNESIESMDTSILAALQIASSMHVGVFKLKSLIVDAALTGDEESLAEIAEIHDEFAVSQGSFMVVLGLAGLDGPFEQTMEELSKLFEQMYEKDIFKNIPPTPPQKKQ